MITREDVKDLRPGDVVELTFLHEYDATTITARGTFPAVTNWFENHEGGKYTLAVVSRAPRLYVNSDRTEPVQGDVVRVEDLRQPDDSYTNLFDPHGNAARPWLEIQEGGRFTRSQSEPDADAEHYRVTLLVDGYTGQVVSP